MDTRIVALSSEKLEDFKAYCRKHRQEVDDSFLYDEDLAEFQIHGEHPTYIALNGEGELIGAASIIADAYQRKGMQARFRILHCESGDPAVYRRLLDEIVKHGEGLGGMFIFVPSVNPGLMEIIGQLGFQVERYSFLLVNEPLQPASYELPEGYGIRAFRPGEDEEAWCAVRNAGFAQLKGSQTPITPDMVAKYAGEADYLNGGMLFLVHGDRPVGIVRCTDDEYLDAPIMNIGPLALLPEYQGKGLGRLLLRRALGFGRENGYRRAILCVNAENERAKALYLQEGFKEAEYAVNYRLDLR
ncbi:GNAT family N-acetyltransferase [Paenibacillus timonensis]|uniref:GNAT family N-acetyltransferase n=1 Tax=Paenibacillus timonensis TaxID=225915 RepID=A0ABW3SBN2_9BACL|nr:GNAT family N-acetyltransferase [Paenibacillus timonensis]MCH1640773.1 GNAT family N-acetyltransferase [Paenibacillus timonensis]